MILQYHFGTAIKNGDFPNPAGTLRNMTSVLRNRRKKTGVNSLAARGIPVVNVRVGATTAMMDAKRAATRRVVSARARNEDLAQSQHFVVFGRRA